MFRPLRPGTVFRADTACHFRGTRDVSARRRRGPPPPRNRAVSDGKREGGSGFFSRPVRVRAPRRPIGGSIGDRDRFIIDSERTAEPGARAGMEKNNSKNMTRRTDDRHAANWHRHPRRLGSDFSEPETRGSLKSDRPRKSATFA